MEDKSTDSEAEKVDTIIEKVLREQGRQAILHYAKIKRHWDIIIGSSLAKKSAPSKLIKKTLTILVEDAAYAHHLKYYEQSILDLIASPEICGEGAVTKVTFRVGKLQVMTEEISLTEPRNPSVDRPNNQLLDDARKTSDAIGDQNLKEMFARCMAKILTKKNPLTKSSNQPNET